MRRFTSLGVAVSVLGVCLASAGCAATDPAPTGNSSPAPDPQRASKPKDEPDSSAPRSITYDPARPDIKIDLAWFSSALAANDPRVPEWRAKKGLIAQVQGIMGGFHTNPKTG